MAIADFVAEAFETDALRAAIAARGVQHTAMGPWSAGTANVFLTDRPATTAARPARRSSPGAARGALRGAGGGGPGRRRGDPHRGRGRLDHDGATAGRPASSWPAARRSARGSSSAGADPKRRPDRRSSTPSSSGRGWAGGPATSGRPGRSPRSTWPSRACPGSPRPATAPRPAAGCAAGSSSRPGSTTLERAFDASKYGRMSDAPYLEATIPSPGRPGPRRRARSRARQVMSVHVQ